MTEDEDFIDKKYTMNWSNIEAMLDRVCCCGQWDQDRAKTWFELWEDKITK